MAPFVVLAIILFGVFLPLDGVDGLDCYTCSSDKNDGDYSPDCKEINSKTPSLSCSENQTCLSTLRKSSVGGLMTRSCGTSFVNTRPGRCVSVKFFIDTEVCVCDSKLCTVDGGGGSGSGGGVGSGGGRLKCYQCTATKDNDSKNCRRPNNTTSTCDNGVSSVKIRSTGGGVNDVERYCYDQGIVEECLPGLIIDNVELVTCACNKELCNSAQYLHRTSLFVIGLIAFTALLSGKSSELSPDTNFSIFNVIKSGFK